MPCLHYSNRLDRLVFPLAQALNNRDPFDPIEIVVPNFSLEKWLSLQLAQIHGIAANLRFLTLEKSIKEFIQQKIPNQHFSLLKPETTQCLLQEILKAKLDSTEPIWKPIQNYIAPKLGLSSDAFDQRVYQLADRLARLFLEYEYSRNDELLDVWRSGKNAIDFDPLSTESWQRSLWEELFGEQGRLTEYNICLRKNSSFGFQTELYTLPQFLESAKNQENILGKQTQTEKKPLHIFGISYLSRFHQKTLTEEMSQFREISVYALNPCMEFWEDVNSLSEIKSEAKRSLVALQKRFETEKNVTEDEYTLGELLVNENDNPFLQAWGRPGRENISLLNQWVEWDFTPWFLNLIPESESKNTQNLTSDQSNANSVLAHLQQDILFREPRRKQSLGLKQDESMMILSSSNPRREVEAIANLIWEWIRTDSELKFNDCLVIAHDMELYQHEIEQVFESIHRLPYHLIDGVSGSAGRLQEAAASLLGLCFTEYTRKDIFSLLNNPCFMHQFDDELAENHYGETLQIEQWLKWTDHLNVFFGVDTENHLQMGYTHLEKELYHWEQAFRRLTLGDMLLEEEDLVAVGKQQIVPISLSEEMSEEASRFILIVRSLIADTKNMNQWTMSGNQWGQYLLTLIKTYLKPYNDADTETFQNLQNSILSLRDLDLGQKSGKTRLKFSSIFEYFKQKQKSALVQKGQYLAQGVTVSSFQPMRPIPFKAVFLLGMGEGQFPTPYRRDTLDLRNTPVRLKPQLQGKQFRERLLGDVSMTERDRYMFLETLVSTRKHLVLSYVSRNDRTDDELNPSSIIQTLLDELNHGYLDKDFQATKHPLKSYSKEYFPELSRDKSLLSDLNLKLPNHDSAAFRQARAFRMREDLDHEFPGLSRISPKHFKIGTFDSLMDGPISSNKSEEERALKQFRLKTSRLRKFLESPLQSSANYLLSIREDEESVEENIHEPFVLEQLNEWSFLRKIWSLGLSEKNEPNWNDIYQKQALILELEGIMPTGLFGETMFERHLRILGTWQKNLTSSINTSWHFLHQNMKQYRFGSGAFSGLKINRLLSVHPALRLSEEPNSTNNMNGEDKKIFELQGETEWWFVDEEQNWHVIHFKEGLHKPKQWLRHFLDLLILRAKDLLPEDKNYTAWCFTGTGEAKSQAMELPAINTAKMYLMDLIHSMNTEQAISLMPVESVFEIFNESIQENDYNLEFTNWMENKLNDDFNKISCHYGPVKYLENAPFPDNPHQLTKERFDLFFEILPNILKA